MPVASKPPEGASVAVVSAPSPAASERLDGIQGGGLDAESRAWIAALSGANRRREQAQEDLHALLLRAARFEINRRGATRPHLRGGDLDDLAQQAADDALLAILGKLETFRGESRFTTWAYKFALLEAAVKIRRRDWQGRELPLEAEHWAVLAGSGQSPAAEAESQELIAAIGEAIRSELSPHQREVFVAATLNEVPIDVLAERLSTTRGALYKTIHDARKKLRAHLGDAGLRFAGEADSTERRP